MKMSSDFETTKGKVIGMQVFGAGPNSAMITFALGPNIDIGPFVVLADPTGPEPDTGTMPQVFSALASLLNTAFSERLDVQVQYVQARGQFICRGVSLGSFVT